MSQLDRIVYRPSMTPAEVRWDRIENKLRVLVFASVPESIAWSSQLAGRERCTDILFDVMVEVAPGSKRDRAQVYKDLIWKENVDPKDLHDNLHRWMFTHGRLGKFHVVRPDPSLQWDALKSKVDKWLKNDTEFAFRFNTFVYREGVIITS